MSLQDWEPGVNDTKSEQGWIVGVNVGKKDIRIGAFDRNGTRVVLFLTEDEVDDIISQLQEARRLVG